MSHFRKKISVIIPFYNEEAYLGSAIESVLKQTLQDIEIILVNDGSKDNSFKIAEKFANENHNVIYIQQENKGLGAARNSGLQIASGQYIYFLDSDDYLEPNAMEKCYLSAIKNTADIVTFNSQVNKYDSSQFIIDYSHRNFLRRNMTGREFLYEGLKSNNLHFPVWLYFYKSEFLKQNNIQFEKVIYEDRIFTIKVLLDKPSITYLDEVLHCRRIREESIMTKKKSIKHLEGAYVNILESYAAYSRIQDNDIQVKIEMLKFVKRNLNIFVGIARSIDNSKEKRFFKNRVFKFLLSYPKIFSLKQMIKLGLA
ncbi:glycosyltransferase family 2 protein [Priestia megaterium]|uniref:glycosyltransferase family 2 protein n=1 Tax=Priestia megaterium TaxID=1404 RepID=UPI00164287A4|nr:glycosyltransferase [Priestia megaterium]